MKAFDVIVVGGGIVGLSIAVELAVTSRLKVTCIDPSNKPEGSATYAAGAMLGAFAEVIADAQSEADREEIGFRVASARMYPEYLRAIASLSAVQVPHRTGTFIIANGAGRHDQRNIASICSSIREHSEQVELVTPSSIPGYRPSPSHNGYEAIFIPSEGFVDTGALLTGLRIAIQKAEAASLLDARVHSVDCDNHRVIGVTLECGDRLSAGVVVLAAGALTQRILDNSNLTKPNVPRIVAGKGVSVTVQSDAELPYVIRTPNRDFACGTHVVPRGAQSIYIGATNRIAQTPGGELGASAGEIYGLLHSAIYEINTGFRTATLESFQYGSRPLSTDRFPLIGPLEVSGLYIASGTYRNGVVMAPAISKILAAEIRGETSPIKNPFSPNNRVVTKPSRSDILLAGVSDLVSFIQEPTGALPFNRSEELKNFLYILLQISVGTSGEFAGLREEIAKVLDDYPLAEAVPIIYYLCHSRVSDGKPLA